MLFRSGALKRDLELVRAENQRRDLEAAELKSSVAKQLEGERREMHIAGERRGHDYAQKEKALLAEISSLRDIANAKDVLLEKQKTQCDEARNSSERLKAELEDERARRTEKDASLRGLKEDYEEQLDALAARDKTLSAEVSALKKSLAAVSGEALENRGEAENLRASLERLKAAFEDERRKRSEAEAASSGARTALEEKREEAGRHAADVEALKNGLARLKKAFEDERSKRVECELLAQTAHSALREKQEEFLRSQKLLEQLKEKIRSWKNK